MIFCFWSCWELEICANMKIINFVTHTVLAQVRCSICQTNREPLVCTVTIFSVLFRVISLPPPFPIHNKTFSDQHWRYVQKYDHLDARFITVTYHIKAFSLFAIDWFCSEYWGPINNATFRKSPPFSIQENPSSNFTKGHKAVKKGPRQIVHKNINASWDLYFTLSSINKFFKDKWRQNARWG